jgi:hypothetical protein
MSKVQDQMIHVDEVAVKQTAGWLRVFMEPGQVTELRVLKARFKGVFHSQTLTGFYDFDHVDEMDPENWTGS